MSLRRRWDELVYLGDQRVELDVIEKKTTGAPALDTSDGVKEGQQLVNTYDDKAYICRDITEGAPVWAEVTAVSSV